MQHLPSPFNSSLFSQKSSIIDVKLSSTYASDKLSFSSYSKVYAFLQIFFFQLFAQRNPYTARNVCKTTHCKKENDIGRYYH